MDYEFGYWYVLLSLFVLPGFYYLYRFYTKAKKSNSLKNSRIFIAYYLDEIRLIDNL